MHPFAPRVDRQPPLVVEDEGAAMLSAKALRLNRLHSQPTGGGVFDAQLNEPYTQWDESFDPLDRNRQ